MLMHTCALAHVYVNTCVHIDVPVLGLDGRVVRARDRLAKDGRVVLARARLGLDSRVVLARAMPLDTGRVLGT